MRPRSSAALDGPSISSSHDIARGATDSVHGSAWASWPRDASWRASRILADPAALALGALAALGTYQISRAERAARSVIRWLVPAAALAILLGEWQGDSALLPGERRLGHMTIGTLSDLGILEQWWTTWIPLTVFLLVVACCCTMLLASLPARRPDSTERGVWRNVLLHPALPLITAVILAMAIPAEHGSLGAVRTSGSHC